MLYLRFPFSKYFPEVNQELWTSLRLTGPATNLYFLSSEKLFDLSESLLGRDDDWMTLLWNGSVLNINKKCGMLLFHKKVSGLSRFSFSSYVSPTALFPPHGRVVKLWINSGFFRITQSSWIVRRRCFWISWVLGCKSISVWLRCVGLSAHKILADSFIDLCSLRVFPAMSLGRKGFIADASHGSSAMPHRSHWVGSSNGTLRCRVGHTCLVVSGLCFYRSKQVWLNGFLALLEAVIDFVCFSREDFMTALVRLISVRVIKGWEFKLAWHLTSARSRGIFNEVFRDDERTHTLTFKQRDL